MGWDSTGQNESKSKRDATGARHCCAGGEASQRAMIFQQSKAPIFEKSGQPTPFWPGFTAWLSPRLGRFTLPPFLFPPDTINIALLPCRAMPYDMT